MRKALNYGIEKSIGFVAVLSLIVPVALGVFTLLTGTGLDAFGMLLLSGAFAALAVILAAAITIIAGVPFMWLLLRTGTFHWAPAIAFGGGIAIAISRYGIQDSGAGALLLVDALCALYGATAALGMYCVICKAICDSPDRERIETLRFRA